MRRLARTGTSRRRTGCAWRRRCAAGWIRSSAPDPPGTRRGGRAASTPCGARLTQELGDDPMSTMMRQIMTLFDEYQSRENAKHPLGAMKENARQGFWNGSRPPLGYRIVVAEHRGAKTKK